MNNSDGLGGGLGLLLSAGSRLRRTEGGLGVPGWGGLIHVRFKPLGDDDFGVCEGFLTGGAVGGTSSEFGNFGDEGFVFVAPVENDLVFGHSGLATSLLER
jgi:hypothetical protein